MRRWDGLVEKYLNECESRGLAEGTQSKRARELARLGSWLKRQRPRLTLEGIGADAIATYVGTRSPFKTRSTVSSVMSDVRCMGEFLVREGVWQTNPLRWMKGPKLDPRMHVPRRINRADLRAIWAAAGRRRSEFSRYQAVCMLAIVYATGLRRGELERLDVEDWDRDHGLLTIDGRKTGRERRVPVNEGAWRCIEAYLPHRHNVLERTGRIGERALLVGRDGQRWAGRNVNSMVQQLARTARVESVTLHRFRHSCASDLLEEGASVPEVQRFLGHAAVQSTMRYVQLSDPERSAAVAKHPINELLAGNREAREER